MAKVDAVNNYKNSPYSVFGAIAQGTIIGGGLGYAAKYLLPVDAKELTGYDKAVQKTIVEQSRKAKELPIEAIRNLENKTPAQDVFLKWVEKQPTIRQDSKSPFGSLRNLIKENNLDASGKEELRNIIAQVNKKANDIAKLHIKAHMKAIKMERRSAMAYILVGSVAGFFAGLAKKVITG